MYIATIVRVRLIEHLAQSECSLRHGFDTWLRGPSLKNTYMGNLGIFESHFLDNFIC
jgi:hypothetical protein